MLVWSEVLLRLAAGFIWLALVSNIFRVSSKSLQLTRMAHISSRCAWVTLTLSLLARTIALGHLTYHTLFDTLLLLSWVILSIYSYFEWKQGWPILGVVVFAALAATSTFSLTLERDIRPLLPILQSRLLIVHITLNFSAYGAFFLSFILGLMYLGQEYQLKKKKITPLYYILPGLETLEKFAHTLVSIGFPLLTMGIVFGSIYAKTAWDSFWHWEPKETWSLITWLVYAIYMHLRYVRGWRGKRAMILVLIGFGAVLFNYFGVSLNLATEHRFLR